MANELEIINSGLYTCDLLGNIYSHWGKDIRKMRPAVRKDGYLHVILNTGTLKKCNVLVHRLVYTFHKGQVAQAIDLNHIDGNKANNAMSNLELMSRSDNVKHAYRTGLYGEKRKIAYEKLRGIGAPSVKLSEADVWSIRALRDKKVSSVKISKIYNISQTQVVRIGKRTRWAYLAEEVSSEG